MYLVNQDVYRIGKCIFQRDCVIKSPAKTSALLLVIFIFFPRCCCNCYFPCLETFQRQHNAGLSGANDDIMALTRKCTCGANDVSGSFSYILQCFIVLFLCLKESDRPALCCWCGNLRKD